MPLRMGGPVDQPQLERWLFRQDRLYAKFSLGSLSDWLEHGVCFVAEEPELMSFLLAVRVSSDFASIIGLAGRTDEGLSRTTPELVGALFDILRRDRIRFVSCITSMAWLVDLLHPNGFAQVGRLASYVKADWRTPGSGDPTVSIRACTPADVPTVAEVDGRAFEPLWRQHQAIVDHSLRRSDWFVVAERAQRIVGYVCGTWRGNHGHISRLAVEPPEQGRGVGARLLYESLLRLRRARVGYVTLNTQEENEISRRLYERFGFRLSHLDLRVFVRQIDTFV